jgi:hypothetical protein
MLDPRLGKIYEDSIAFGKQLPRHNQDGPGDAARHAYASAKVADLYGPTASDILGWLHEATSFGQDRRSVDMDDYNNRVGRDMRGMDDASLREAIIGAINEGGLKTLPKGIDAQGYAGGGLVPIGNQGVAPYGGRYGSTSPKGKGYFGLLPAKHGHSSEISSEDELGEYPLMVPTLSKEELELLLSGEVPTGEIQAKAQAHANMRRDQGKNTFAEEEGLYHPKPTYRSGGLIQMKHCNCGGR